MGYEIRDWGMWQETIVYYANTHQVHLTCEGFPEMIFKLRFKGWREVGQTS